MFIYFYYSAIDIFDINLEIFELLFFVIITIFKDYPWLIVLYFISNVCASRSSHPQLLRTRLASLPQARPTTNVIKSHEQANAGDKKL